MLFFFCLLPFFYKSRVVFSHALQVCRGRQWQCARYDDAWTDPNHFVERNLSKLRRSKEL
jgi:hypothetical protein